MQLLDGKATAQKLREEIAHGVAALKEKNIHPGLGVVLVGDDPASRVYVGMKERACEAAGIKSISRRLPETATREDVLAAVQELNENPEAHGILVQAPLPNGVDYDEIAAAIKPEKDVDGVGPFSMGNLLADQPGYAACTAAGIIELLKAYDIPMKGKECVVVGRSVIVGKPVALLMLREHATVTICHSRTEDLAAHTRKADILIAAVGKAELITGEMIKEGAVVVDAGYNRVEGRKGDVGDVEYSSAAQKASYITPVPGGVGPMTIAMLLKQTLQAAETHSKEVSQNTQKPVLLRDKKSNFQTALVGKRLVELELTKRGIDCMVVHGTRKNLLQASNPSVSRTLQIQVKTKRRGNWHSTIDEAEVVKSPPTLEEVKKFWVFVDLKRTPRFWVVPDWWMKNNIYEAHQDYLSQHGGQRAITPDSKHHSIDEKRLEQWLGRWDVLGITETK